RLLLLGSLLSSEALRICAERDIDIVVHDIDTCERLLRHRGGALAVWVKLDSGMHRLGLDPDAFATAHRQLSDSPTVRELLHISHFAQADEPERPGSDRQLDCFRRVRQQLGASQVPLSQANSAALISLPDS